MDELTLWNKKLFPYAYNILGNRDDSQDVIQDVLIRYNEIDSSSISNPGAYLTKAVVNGAINLKKKRDRARQQLITLPEPIVTNQGAENLELDEILNYSMLVLLDTLSTKERAVFLLKEAFDYEHDEIARILSLSTENSRQLLTRGKKKLKARKADLVTAGSGQRQHLEKYVATIRSGDVRTLEQLLSAEVQVLADAGSKLQVVAALTSGIEDTIKLMTYVYEYYQKDLEIKIQEINHQQALLFYRGTTLINCQIFELDPDGKITHIFSVVDPDKLHKI